MSSIGSLTGEISLVDQMTAVLVKLDSVFKATEAGAKRVDESIKHLDRTMSTATLAAQVFGNVIGTAITSTLTQLPRLAFDAAQQTSGAMATIARSTGQTGQALETLTTSFRNVNRVVPDSARNVASAIAEISKQTGATGTELEELTKKMLQFANVNQVDVTESSKLVIKMMNATQIPMSELSSVMDKLTFASQKGGMSVTELAQGIIRGGVAFKQAGFDFDRSVALFTEFSKVGANANDVVASVSRAMSKLAEQGVTDLAGGIKEVIRQIKDAKSFSEGIDIAQKLFGKGQGQALRLVEEIKFGTFDIDPFVKQLQNVEGVLERTSKATESFDEKLAQLKKGFMEAIEPLGQLLLDAFTTFRPHIETAVKLTVQFADSLGKIFKEAKELPEPLLKTGLAIAGIGVSILAVSEAMQALQSLSAIKVVSTMLVGLPAQMKGLATFTKEWVQLIKVFKWEAVVLGLRSIGAALVGLAATPIGMVVLLTTLAISISKVAEAVENFKKHWESGQPLSDFFLAKDDNNLVRQALAWFGVLETLDGWMRKIQDSAMTAWGKISKAIDEARQTGLGRFLGAWTEFVTKVASWAIVSGGKEAWDLLKDTVLTVVDAFKTLWDWINKVQELTQRPIKFLFEGKTPEEILAGTRGQGEIAGGFFPSEQHIDTVMLRTFDELDKKQREAAASALTLGHNVGSIVDEMERLNRAVPETRFFEDMFGMTKVMLPGARTGRPGVGGTGFSPLLPPVAPQPSGARPSFEDPAGASEQGKRLQLLDKAAKEYGEKVAELAQTLRVGDTSLKLFRDAFKTLTPEVLKNFSVQERVVPQIMKLVEAHQQLTPAMQRTLTSYQANRLAISEADNALLEMLGVTEESITAMERAGMSVAEIAQRYNVLPASLEAYREELKLTLSAEEGIASMREALAEQERATAARREQRQQATSQAVFQAEKQRIDMVKQMTMNSTAYQIERINEEKNARIAAAVEAQTYSKELREELEKIAKIQINQLLSEEALAQLERFKKSIGDARVLWERLKTTAVQAAGSVAQAFANIINAADITGMIGKLLGEVEQQNSPTRWQKAWSGIKEGMKGVLDSIPQTIADALTGGGGLRGAMLAIGSQVGTILGTSVGAALGGPFGAKVGAALGSMLGSLIDKFGRPAHEDIRKRVEGWAGPISEGLGKAIAEVAKEKFGGDRLTAEIFSLDRIISEVGGLTDANIDAMTGKLRDVFVLVGKGSLTAAQGVEVLGKNFDNFLKQSTDDMGNWSSSIKEIIELADKYGLEVEAIKEAQKAQAQIVTESFNAIVDGSHQALESYAEIKKRVDEATEAVKKGTGSQEDLTKALTDQFNAAQAASQELKDLGTIAVASFAIAMEHGASFLEALMSVQGGLKQLREAYENLGMNADDPFLNMLLIQEEILTNNPALIKGISGLSSQLVAMSNLNMLNAESFQSLGRLAFNAYTRLQAEVAKAGGTTKDALLPMQQFLQEAAAKAKELGIPLDDNTQMLIDQSKELGIWKEAGLSANEKMMQATDKLTLAIDKLTNALLGIPTSIPNPFADWEMPDLPTGLPTVADQAGEAAQAVDELNYGASPGGLVDIPMLLDKGARAAQDFAAIAIPSLRNVFDVVEDTTALENQTKEIIKLADSTKFIPEDIFGTWETERHADQIHHMSGQTLTLGTQIETIKPNPWNEWKTIEQSHDVGELVGVIQEIPTGFMDAADASEVFAGVAVNSIQLVISAVDRLNQRLAETSHQLTEVSRGPSTPVTPPSQTPEIIYRPPVIGPPGGGGGSIGGSTAAVTTPMDIGDTRVRERMTFGAVDGDESQAPVTKVEHHYFFLGVKETFDVDEALDELTARLPEEARANARNHFGTRMRAALEID